MQNEQKALKFWGTKRSDTSRLENLVPQNLTTKNDGKQHKWIKIKTNLFADSAKSLPFKKNPHFNAELKNPHFNAEKKLYWKDGLKNQLYKNEENQMCQ